MNRHLCLLAAGVVSATAFASALEQETPGSNPAVAAVLAPDGPSRDVSALLAPIIDQSKTPGIVGAIVRSNGGIKVVALGAAGVRRSGDPTLVTTNDLFHLGSCTKAMTATLCALLVEDGTLTWQTTIADALPELRESMNEAYRAATLADLLHHRAGLIANFEGGLGLKALLHAGPPNEARAEFLPGILKLPPTGTPGKSFLYSNAGYTLAGHICERSAKQPYEELIQARLFKPLGITSAGFGPPGRSGPGEPDQPRGHRTTGTKHTPAEPNAKASDNPPTIAPAGTCHMTISDWARFVGLHLAGARGTPTPFLKPTSFAFLHARPTNVPDDDANKDYTCGWIRTTRPWAAAPGDKDPGEVLVHNGSNTMWFCVVWMAPARDFAVLIAANAADKATMRAVDAAASALIMDQVKLETPAK